MAHKRSLSGKSKKSKAEEAPKSKKSKAEEAPIVTTANKKAAGDKRQKLEPSTEKPSEMADIDSIIDEKGKGARKSFLCTWMDGGEPQWVKKEFLEGTPALEEWENLEELVPEEFDPEDVVAQKCATLVSWLRASKRTAWLVGAGLSAAVLPTFRGSGGLWTRSRRAPSAAKASAPPAAPPQPTFSHGALVSLEQAGHVHWLASQNYDNLLMRAGFPASKLSELHGNIFIETCTSCGHTYHRDFEVELPSSKDHETGRFCDQEAKPGRVCGGALRDNIVHFDEQLPWKAITLANAKFLGSDLSLALGTSLRVEPAARLPFTAKRRRRRDAGAPVRCVIVNLQPTPRDGEADLIIRARCDDVLKHVVEALLPDHAL